MHLAKSAVLELLRGDPARDYETKANDALRLQPWCSLEHFPRVIVVMVSFIVSSQKIVRIDDIPDLAR
jgi:hypothetical protein